jgi:hypothetical protein
MAPSTSRAGAPSLPIASRTILTISGLFFRHLDDPTPFVKTALGTGPMRLDRFTTIGAGGEAGRLDGISRAAFAPAGFRVTTFRIWHNEFSLENVWGCGSFAPTPLRFSLSYENDFPTDEKSERINHQLAPFIRWRSRFHPSWRTLAYMRFLRKRPKTQDLVFFIVCECRYDDMNNSYEHIGACGRVG